MGIDDLVQKWKLLPIPCSEANLSALFFLDLLKFLGLKYDVDPTISGGISPDFLVYDKNHQPLLVIENKRRVPVLANQADDGIFKTACQQHMLYKEAIGCDGAPGNGIKQYLQVKNNPANYGLVFNGDFFQLFHRSDGIVFPLTDIKRVTAETLPGLVKQLQFYLENPRQAFTISVWNRKGGVGKTTNTINIAAVLAEKGKRVLVVDFDPQVDLTKGLNLNPEDFKGKLLECFDALQTADKDATRNLLKDLIQYRQFKSPHTGSECHISIFPGHKETLDSFGENTTDKGYQMTNKPSALRRLLALVSSDYDYIFVDASPKADVLAWSGLYAADGVIIPADYDPETLRHVSSISQDLIPKRVRPARMKAAQSKKLVIDDIGPHVLGVVFSNCSNIGVTLTKKVNDYLSEKVHVTRFTNELQRSDMVPVSKFARTPVVFYRPKSSISERYRKLVDEIFFEQNFVDFS